VCASVDTDVILLSMFVCRCRQQQRLKQHDGKRNELEQKERGFMLYVNGANAVPTGSKTTRSARPKSCHKTATAPDCKFHYYWFCFLLTASFLLYLNCAVLAQFLQI